METKRKSDMDDLDVRRKADAASLWCWIATEHHAKKHGDKPWRYGLVTGRASSGMRSDDRNTIWIKSSNSLT